MFGVVEPWGPGWAVRDVREFFFPSSIQWGEDYDEGRGMKRIFAQSAAEALEWATTRQGASLTIDNIFPKHG